MADMRLDGKNNQAKSVQLARSKVYPTNASGELFNMPIDGVVSRVTVVVTKADSTDGATLTVTIDGTSIATADLTSTGIKTTEVTDIAGYTPTGGVMSISSTGGGDGTMFVIAEIDTNNTDGAYLG